jgi:ABC-type dipeptide/oligopeptide/nickel transport system ATPase component
MWGAKYGKWQEVRYWCRWEGETGVTDTDVVLDVRDLQTYFFNRRGILKAVDGVSFSLRRGETLGLVGESGCGKSMTALSLLRLVPQPAARIVGGEILLNGDDVLKKSPQDMRQIRGRRIAMILQDPQTSLNPVFTVGQQLIEAFAAHQRRPRGVCSISRTR